MFKWKYPLWYSRDIKMEDCVLFEMGRHKPGDRERRLFCMSSTNLAIDGFELVGNYFFDGVKNMEIRNARLLSKDAFWNSEDVTVYDSFISGEYLGWNAKNLTIHQLHH